MTKNIYFKLSSPSLMFHFLCCALIIEPTEPVLCLYFICASALFVVSFIAGHICWTFPSYAIRGCERILKLLKWPLIWLSILNGIILSYHFISMSSQPRILQVVQKRDSHTAPSKHLAPGSKTVLLNWTLNWNKICNGLKCVPTLK